MKNAVKYTIMGICGGLLAACIVVAVIAGQNQRRPLKCTGLQVEVLDSMEQKTKHYNDIAEIALEYMHTYTDFRISDVAEHCKVSESTLYGVFKKAYNTTPIEKKQEIFCERAAELLITTDLSVEQISEMLNFSSSSYFRKIFKKHTGKTPLQIRKNTKHQI